MSTIINNRIPRQLRLHLDFALDLVFLAAAVVSVAAVAGDLDFKSTAALVVLAQGLSLGTVLCGSAMATGFYEAACTRSLAQSCARALLLLLLLVPAAYLSAHLLPGSLVPESLLLLASVPGAVLVMGRRIYLAHARRPWTLRPRVLVVGAGERAAEVSRRLQLDGGVVELVGYYPVANDPTVAVPADQVLGVREPLARLARRLRVDEIIVAPSERRGGGSPLRELLDCKACGISVVDVSTHLEKRLEKLDIDFLHAGWLVYGAGFRKGWWRATAKRLLDVVAATALIVAMAPVMLLAALAVKLDSRGPVLYRQQRVGLNGHGFDIVKFRSMRTDAERDGPRWAAQGDDRITRVGRFLRRTRIDELPQLFTVLMGHMSLVGPRPERPMFVEQLAAQIPYYHLRHSIKPGLTGWAQIRYPYAATVDDARQKLQYDLYYIKNYSPLLDVLILFETLAVVMTGEGAR